LKGGGETTSRGRKHDASKPEGGSKVECWHNAAKHAAITQGGGAWGNKGERKIRI